MSPSQQFHVIQGGRSNKFGIGNLEVVPATLKAQPFPVNIQVIEEDTWLVMSSEPVLHEMETHPIRVMTDLIDQQPLTVGDVLVRGKQWLAVVYDLDHEPICEVKWIIKALQKILTLAEQKGITALALPLLGSEHGPLNWSQSLANIIDILRNHAGAHLQRIWLIVKDDQLQAVQDLITAG